MSGLGMFVAPLLVALLPLLPVQSTCLTNYGRTVCGYRCLAAHGDVACAKTPHGICKATSDAPANGQPGVVCWDPPETVRIHYGDKTPLADCVMRRGELTCGYQCQALGDMAKCATTPDGVCRASSRGIVCWDPPPTNYCADDRALPRAQCILSDGDIACGYNCEGRGGQLACATTPTGRCTWTGSTFVCSDPSPPPFCGGRPCDPDRAGSERSWCTPEPDPKRR